MLNEVFLRQRRLFGTWAALPLLACGGTASSPPVHNANSANEPARNDDPLPFAEGGDPLGAEPSEETGGAPPACADGQCFPCDSSICPDGFYCDAELGACAWFPDCAGERLSCECLEKNLPGCTCSSEEAGVRLTCPAK